MVKESAGSIHTACFSVAHIGFPYLLKSIYISTYLICSTTIINSYSKDNQKQFNLRIVHIATVPSRLETNVVKKRSSGTKKGVKPFSHRQFTFEIIRNRKNTIYLLCTITLTCLSNVHNVPS